MNSADVARYRIFGRGNPPARRSADDGPLSVEQAANARREADYIARRNGVREPRLNVWRA